MLANLSSPILMFPKFIAACNAAFLGLAAIIMLHPLMASAAIRHVPGDHPTIQAALDAAEASDEIIVAPGVYPEIIIFPGIDMTLRSDDPTSPAIVAATVIDGQQAGSVVTFAGTETTATLLTGFTIMNGLAETGGGIAGNMTLATIANNVITSNTALENFSFTGVGGGIAECNGLIMNNRIEYNVASYSGGGLYRCNGDILNNVISHNRIDQGGYGGGLRFCNGRIAFNEISHNDSYDGTNYNSNGGGLESCDGIVEFNVISHNLAKAGGGFKDCDAVIQNNIITSNTALGSGGGLNNCNNLIQNNLIAFNSANQDGGAINSCVGFLVNNTILYNKAAGRGGGVFYINAALSNCLLWGNDAPTSPQLGGYNNPPLINCLIQDWPDSHVISDDPLFVNAAGGDFRIMADSPCRDAGNVNRLMGLGWRDLDGNSRLAGPAVDIGCFEWGAAPDTDGDLLSDDEETSIGTLWNAADTDGDGLLDGIELLRGTNPLMAEAPAGLNVPGDWPAIQTAIFLSYVGETITVEPGEYMEHLNFLGRDLILQSVNPHHRPTVEATLLKNEGWGAVVEFMGIEPPTATLRGFTLTGGNWNPSGGIDGHSSRATIEWCIVRNNRGVYGGGAAHCDGLIQHCELLHNTSTSIASSGGGVHNSAALVRQCKFEYNVAELGSGGAIGAQGRLEDCVIRYNSAGGAGGGVMSPNEGVYGCLIEYNTAGSNGGGVAYGGPIVNCIIRGNASGDVGAGIYSPRSLVSGCIVMENEGMGIYARDRVDYLNNIIANNEGGGLLPARNSIVRNNSIYGNGDWGLFRNINNTVTNNIIWGNATQLSNIPASGMVITYNCIEGWTEGGTGNITLNPMFANPANGDFSLLPGSPCIDAGAPGLSDACMPPGQGAARADMGALGGTENCAHIGSGAYSLARTVIGAVSANPLGLEYGDLNDDEKINALDVILALRLKDFDNIPGWE